VSEDGAVGASLDRPTRLGRIMAAGVASETASFNDEVRLNEQPFEDIALSTFTRPTTIDNPWLALQPGKQLVFEGITDEGGKEIPHRVLFTATDLTKVIAGIPTRVVWELDYSGGELVETELIFFAQDDTGTVWHLGQYPEAYEGGQLVEVPTWIHGLHDARAGIIMQAAPQLGGPSYSQGWGPKVDYTDRAQVAAVGARTQVPFGSYGDVLVIEEFSEPNAFQLKYYARGVGNIRVGWRGEDATRETLELVNVIQLAQAHLTEVHAQVLALEQRATQISPDVYAHTTLMETAPATVAT
jgi:hypothetical protein